MLKCSKVGIWHGDVDGAGRPGQRAGTGGYFREVLLPSEYLHMSYYVKNYVCELILPRYVFRSVVWGIGQGQRLGSVHTPRKDQHISVLSTTRCGSQCGKYKFHV